MIKPLRTRQPAKAKIKFNLLQKILLLLGLVILVITALPAVVILIIGLLPTITIILIDSKNTSKLTMVGCFNLAGVFVCLMNIFNQFNLNHAITILGNVFNIIIMLGAAALGMVLYYELPNLFLFISKASAQRRLRNIDNKLEKIADEWGQECIAEVNQK